MNYIEEAHRTLSPQFHGDLVSERAFRTALVEAISGLQKLDNFKKALFYGKDNYNWHKNNIDLSNLPKQVCSAVNCNPQNAVNIIHAIIGKATEAGELLEALLAAIEVDGGLDIVNLREEVGDGLWYDAILLKAIGSNFEEAMTININKLKKRFPEKFTEEKANNRDLEAERIILEK